jgi:hypothetical protein
MGEVVIDIGQLLEDIIDHGKIDSTHTSCAGHYPPIAPRILQNGLAGRFRVDPSQGLVVDTGPRIHSPYGRLALPAPPNVTHV